MQIIPVSDVVFSGHSYKAGRSAAKRVMNDIQRSTDRTSRFDTRDMQIEEHTRKVHNKASKALRNSDEVRVSKGKKFDYNT